MAGRNPKPTALKQAAGNPGHRPLNKKEPKPDLGEPSMPKGLPKAARKKWKEMVALLLTMKVLTKADGDALASYCRAYAILEKVQAEIEKNGATFTAYSYDKEGELVPIGIKTNPAVTIADKMIKLMRAIGSDFGLSPVSRARLHTEPDGQPEDPMESFLRRKASPSVTQ
jgi:P27 family predicted phage terminase small subunit